jgi:hypothetical protein
MTSIQPGLWVDRGAHAVAFFQAAFGATVLHHVGDGEDIVAQPECESQCDERKPARTRCGQSGRSLHGTPPPTSLPAHGPGVQPAAKRSQTALQNTPPREQKKPYLDGCQCAGTRSRCRS